MGHAMRNATAGFKRIVCCLTAACMLGVGMPLVSGAGDEAQAEETKEGSAMIVSLDVSGYPAKNTAYVGDTFNIAAVVKCGGDNLQDEAISFSSSDDSIVSVSSGGVASVKGIGSVKITANYAGSEYYSSASNTKTIYTYGGHFVDDARDFYVSKAPEGDIPGEVCLAYCGNTVTVKAGVFEIPDAVSHEGGVYRVVSVGQLNPNFPTSVFGATPQRQISKIVLPAHLNRIGDYAFCNFSKLTSVTSKDGGSVRTIGMSAFSNCSNLNNCPLISEAKSIGDNAFSGCAQLVSVDLNDELEYLGYSAFYGCAKIEKACIPGSVRTVSANAFYGCVALVDLTIGDGVEVLGSSAFFHCAGLVSVNIPDSVKALTSGEGSNTVQYGAFAHCASLEELIISKDSSLKDLRGAFNGCTSLKTIFVPDTVEDFSSFTFFKCSALKEIKIQENSLRFSVGSDGGLYDRAETMLYCLPTLPEDGVYVGPDTLISVGAYVFNGNKDLKKAVIPGSGDGGSIGIGAFGGCTSLEEVSLPSGELDEIGVSAFANCESLKDLDFSNVTSVGSIGISAFQGCSSFVKISLPPIRNAARKGDYYTDYGSCSYLNYKQKTQEAQAAVDSAQSKYDAASSAYEAASDDEKAESRVKMQRAKQELAEANNALSNLANTAFFYSGYQGYWHNDNGPVLVSAIGSDLFKDCTSLKTVVFNAYDELGCFAYVPGNSGKMFAGCSSLENLIFDGEQPYWLNPNKAMQNATFTDYWSKCGIDAPNLYYSVDYYATQVDPGEKVNREDAVCSLRVKRGSSSKDIATSNNALVESGDVFDLKSQDIASSGYGLPDPNKAAEQAGLDQRKKWVWKLGGNQSVRDTLMDSTYAYLAEATDLDKAFLKSEKVDLLLDYLDKDMTKLTDGYDYDRFGSTYGRSEDFKFTAGSNGVGFDDLSVICPDGAVIQLDDLVVSLWRPERSDDGKGIAYTEIDSSASMTSGAYLLKAHSASEEYSGELSQWIIVKGHSGMVSECYGSNITKCAIYADGYDGMGASVSKAPYSVVVGEGDNALSFVAAGVAGMVGGSISIDGSCISESLSRSDAGNVLLLGNSAAISATLEKRIQSSTNVKHAYRYGDSDGERYTAEEIALRCYCDLRDDNGTLLGENYASYKWGTQAILIRASDVWTYSSLAPYAYATSSPIFICGEDGTVGVKTLKAISDFKTVLLAVSDDAVADNAAQAISSVGVACARADNYGSDPCTISLNVAEELLSSGLIDCSNVVICDGAKSQFVHGSLALSGVRNGITLVSTCSADTKRVFAFLRNNRDRINSVYLSGESSSNIQTDSCQAASLLSELWNEDADVSSLTKITAGDSLVVDGIQYILNHEGKVDSTGICFDKVKNLDIGDAILYNGQEYEIGSLEGEMKIDIASATMSGVESEVYTGEEVRLPLSLSYHGRVLVEGSDYSVEYENNVSAGTGSLCVTGLGNYKGTVKASFTIEKAPSEVKLAAKTVTYTGSAISVDAATVTGSTGAVTYAYYSDAACTKAVTVCKDAGIYYVKAIVAASANYNTAISKAVKLVINKKGQTAKVSTAKKSIKRGKSSKVKVTKIAEKAKYTCKKVKKGSSKYLTVTKSGKIKVSKKAKKGKIYKIKVKFTFNATKNYGKRTVTKTIKVKAE